MKFLVADDHPLVRKALALTLEKVGPDARVLEADSLPTALDVLASHPDVDLFLMDLFMPGSQGVEAVHEAKAAAGPVPVAVVSGDESPETALAVLAAGAAGYLPKSLPEDVMRAALSLVLAGGVYVPALVARGGVRPAAPVAAYATPGNGHQPLARALPLASGAPGISALTPRQREVLELVVEGMSNKEIAERLALAEATVKVHITAILRAYGVNSRAKAIGAASREREGRLQQA